MDYLNEEKELYALIRSTLEEYYDETRYSTKYVNPTNNINYVKKILSDLTVKSRVKVLIGLLDSIKVRISKGDNYAEIVNAMGAKAHMIKNTSKVEKEQIYDKKIKEEERKMKNSEKDIEREKKQESLFEKKYEKYVDLSREELIKYNDEYTEELSESAALFRKKDAKGKIIGKLNQGLYGKTQGTFVRNLREAGAKVNNSKGIIIGMSDELLKYRAIGLEIICDGQNKKIERFKRTGRIPDENEYNMFLDSCYRLGVFIKNMYYKAEKVTPKKEIAIALLDKQYVMPGIFPEIDKLLEDEEPKNNKGRSRTRKK